jgi:hypothetical protein
LPRHCSYSVRWTHLVTGLWHKLEQNLIISLLFASPCHCHSHCHEDDDDTCYTVIQQLHNSILHFNLYYYAIELESVEEDPVSWFRGWLRFKLYIYI